MKKSNEIITLLNNPTELRKLISDYHPYDIAKIISDLTGENRKKLFNILTNEELAEALSYINVDEISDVLEPIDENKIVNIFNEMETDDIVDILDELHDDQAQKLISLLDEDIRDDVTTLSEYNDDQAGSIMNSNFLKIQSGVDIKEAMKVLVKDAPNVETIETIFVVDQNNQLVGIIDLKKLIISKSPKQVDDIMNPKFQYANVFDKIDEVVTKVQHYDIYTLPILENGVIKGIITMDDALESISNVIEEDYAKLAGLTEEEEFQDSVKQSIKKRIPWLIILLLLDVVVIIVLALFSNVIDSIPILAFLQVAILGLAGNCGTQTLSVTVRKLSTDALKTKGSTIKHILKEFLLGLTIGLILAIVSFILVYIMMLIKNEEIKPIELATVLSISILIAVSLSNLFGAIIPIFFNRLKIDPAVASGPFITTLNDIIAISVYFSVALLILSNYLL